jgi:hypothetical protein
MPQSQVSVTRAPHAASTTAPISQTSGGVEWRQSYSWIRVHVPLVLTGENGEKPIPSKEHRWVEVRIEENKLVIELVKNGSTYPIRELLLHDVAKEIDTYSIEDGNYVMVELNKVRHDLWPCLLRAPTSLGEKSFLVDDATLARWHGDEVEGKHQEILHREHRRLACLLCAEEDSKLADQKLCSVSARIQDVRVKLNPTMEELRTMLREIVYMHRISSTALEEDEQEEFRDEQEATLTAEELFEKSDEHRWTDPPTEVHFLRLAAIRHYHCESTRRLVEFYTYGGMQYDALYFVLRLALYSNDGWANSTIARNVQNGELPYLPRYTALAIYFFQRAAQAGCTDAMLSLANISINEAGLERDSTIGTARAVQWIDAAEYRGAPGAYLLQARLYSTGTCGREKNAKLADEYMRRVMETNDSLLPWALRDAILKMRQEETDKAPREQPCEKTSDHGETCGREKDDGCCGEPKPKNDELAVGVQ